MQFSISTRPLGPVLLKQWSMFIWWADLTTEALNKRGFCYKGESVWQSRKCHHLPIQPRLKSSSSRRDNQTLVSCFRESCLPLFHSFFNLLSYFIFFNSPVRYVFFLEPCKLDIINRKISSIALCVSKCPTAELKNYNELTQFALKNGEKLTRNITKVIHCNM